MKRKKRTMSKKIMATMKRKKRTMRMEVSMGTTKKNTLKRSHDKHGAWHPNNDLVSPASQQWVKPVCSNIDHHWSPMVTAFPASCMWKNVLRETLHAPWSCPAGISGLQLWLTLTGSRDDAEAGDRVALKNRWGLKQTLIFRSQMASFDECFLGRNTSSNYHPGSTLHILWGVTIYIIIYIYIQLYIYITIYVYSISYIPWICIVSIPWYPPGSPNHCWINPHGGQWDQGFCGRVESGPWGWSMGETSHVMGRFYGNLSNHSRQMP